jgi:hypothetical protein
MTYAPAPNESLHDFAGTPLLGRHVTCGRTSQRARYQAASTGIWSETLWQSNLPTTGNRMLFGSTSRAHCSEKLRGVPASVAWWVAGRRDACNNWSWCAVLAAALGSRRGRPLLEAGWRVLTSAPPQPSDDAPWLRPDRRFTATPVRRSGLACILRAMSGTAPVTVRNLRSACPAGQAQQAVLGTYDQAACSIALSSLCGPRARRQASQRRFERGRVEQPVECRCELLSSRVEDCVRGGQAVARAGAGARELLARRARVWLAAQRPRGAQGPTGSVYS